MKPAMVESASVVVRCGNLDLPGTLTIPASCRGVVVFAHGSGSSRSSPRNVQVARVLNEGGCATLLFDLLTEEEALDRGNVFDIELLGRRVREASGWLETRKVLAGLPVGYFGASTGAAAALVAAADLGRAVAAVVSRGGRPDLAGAALGAVTAPTLLIVGSLDLTVLELNRQAQARLTCPSRIVVVRGASHLFEEPGTLEEVAAEARRWFIEHFFERSVPPSAADPALK
jgi:putative phosphoribosyl transferase